MDISGESIQENGMACAKALRSVSIREASVGRANEQERVTEDEAEDEGLGLLELETQGLEGHQQNFGFIWRWEAL